MKPSINSSADPSVSSSANPSIHLSWSKTYLHGKSVRSWCDRQIDPSWWTHWAMDRSNHCSMTGFNKSHGMCYPVCGMMQEPLLLIGRVAHVAAAGFLTCYLSGSLPYVWCHITINKMCWVHRKIKHFLSSIHLSVDLSNHPSIHWSIHWSTILPSILLYIYIYIHVVSLVQLSI